MNYTIVLYFFSALEAVIKGLVRVEVTKYQGQAFCKELDIEFLATEEDTVELDSVSFPMFSLRLVHNIIMLQGQFLLYIIMDIHQKHTSTWLVKFNWYDAVS